MNYAYDFTEDSHPIELDPHYWLDGQRISQAFCQALPIDLADLLDVGMAVYAADRRSARDFKNAASGQRSIHIQVGVRNTQLWADTELIDKLEVLLHWMSGDNWRFEFVERQAVPSPAEADSFLFELPPEPPTKVSLFSGGLDSLAGSVRSLEEGLGRSHVLVSGYTKGNLLHQQQLQVNHIRSVLNHGASYAASTQIRHVAVPFGIRKPVGHREEKSQRTRALVFILLGVATAVQAGTDTLWIYENGVGALNLPLNETQLGVDNYKGVHPRTLALAEDFLKLALRQEVKIVNPFLFSTKAQMCKFLNDSEYVDCIQHTVSCDGFPQRIPNEPSQCGHCTSCVLRRQSLLASELHHYDGGYRYDVLQSPTTLDSSRLYGLEAMRNQAQVLESCLASADPWHSLCSKFPELARTEMELEMLGDPGGKGAIRNRIIRLFRTYAWEWGWFIELLRKAA